MNDVLPPLTSLILIAVMNNPRDLEIARVLGWYRIPLRTAPKVISVDYLAFYQTAAFGENKWRIQFFAPVKGHELTTRADLLKDEFNHERAQQEYYKIQLGDLQELSEPILTNKWRRITFLYTTGAHFKDAQTLRDLIIDDNERRVLWQALRERADVLQEYYISDQDKFDLDPAILAAFLGINELEDAYKSN
jgi:hypothetical protein